MSPFWSGVLALGLIHGAYASEVFRGAFQAVPKGQLEAALAFGMSPFLAFRRIKLPLAFDAAGSTAKLFEVKAMPSSFLVGRDGTIRAIHAGYRDDEAGARERELQKILAEH